MWVIGDLLVMVAWMLGEAAVGNADSVALLVVAGLQPNAVTFVVDDAVVNIPPKAVEQAYRHEMSNS